jgi:hypothetical protein
LVGSTVMPLYSVKGLGGGGSSPPPGNPDVSNAQPTKQSMPTIPSIMTGIKMINDALMIPPALPIPMTCCGWIKPIHHQYYLFAGIFENQRK